MLGCSFPWHSISRWVVVALGTAAAANGQALPTLSLTPSTVTFTYVIAAAFPAAQTMQVKRSGSGAQLVFTATVSPAAPWLIVSPTTGNTGTSISLRVNPSSLIAGSYTTVVQVDATGSAGPATATIILVVKNPPPTMSAEPSSLQFVYKTDDAQGPDPQTTSITTSGEPFSFTAIASGGTWLSASPTVGVVLSGSPVTLTISADVTGLTPGSYTGKVTLTSTTAANKTTVVSVTLTVSPGTAVISSIWPSAAPIGSNDTTITVRGTHLFKASVVQAGTTDLTSTWISSTALLAVIPRTLMTTQGTLDITVVNNPQPSSNAISFTVTPTGPTVQAMVNAASFGGATPPIIAPGEIVSIFGSGLGPTTALVATPSGGAFPTTLGSPAAMVEFEVTTNNWVAAPMVLAQANLINCQVPFAVIPASSQSMRVTYNSQTSATVTFQAVTADPGLFTVDSSGLGQAAALNYDSNTQTYGLNSASNPVPKGGIIVLYLTGAGAINPLPNTEGALSQTPAPSLVNTPSVTIGGEAASVLGSAAVPGALGGLAQLNVSVPSTLRAAKDHSVVVTMGGRSTPVTATIAVK